MKYNFEVKEERGRRGEKGGKFKRIFRKSEKNPGNLDR